MCSTCTACVISSLDLIIIGIAALCVLAFAIFFRLSSLGLQMRATAENFEAASLSGVNADRVFATALAIGTALAAVGGILLASTNLLSVDLSSIAFLAFPAIVIGGSGEHPGGSDRRAGRGRHPEPWPRAMSARTRSR